MVFVDAKMDILKILLLVINVIIPAYLAMEYIIIIV